MTTSISVASGYVEDKLGKTKDILTKIFYDA